MSDCKHKWIGNTCVECGVDWGVNAKFTMAKQEEEIGLLRAEIAETDLLIQDVHNALLSSRRRKAEVAREMVPKDDLLVLQGMLQGSRKRVDELISERDQWRELAEDLYSFASWKCEDRGSLWLEEATKKLTKLRENNETL